MNSNSMKSHADTNLGKLIVSWAGLALAGLGTLTAQAQHGHLDAGAASTALGSPVIWANGLLYAESTGYIQSMTRATSGTYNGYLNSGPTLTALPGTVANGGPSGNASALGSFLEFKFTLFSAPSGGTFSFWDHGATAPTTTLGVGQTSPLFELSGGEGNIVAGTLGGDPYGHIHGRRFTVDMPGDYSVGFQAFDTSVNGTGGGPIHTPSDVLTIHFQGVPEPGTVTLLFAGGVALALAGWTRRGQVRSMRPYQGPAK